MNLLSSRCRLARKTLLGVGVAAVVLGASASARAQSLTLSNENSLPRLDSEGKQISKRGQAEKPEAISFQDCKNDQRIRFTIQLGLSDIVANAFIEFWASLGSQDCKTATNRSGGTQICWQLATIGALSQTMTQELGVRAIMSGANGKAQAPIKDESVCGTVDITNLSVHILYFKPGDRATPAAEKVVPIEVDTVGPPAPTGLSVKPGNTRITVGWDNISGEGGVTALTGVRVYCDLKQATTVDAGQTCEDVPNDAGPDADADFDAGTTQVCTPNPPTTAACSSPNFVNADGTAILPDEAFNAKYLCGSVSGNVGAGVSAEQVNGAPLVNGTEYVVAVAATDLYGNVGPLSAAQCEKPEETTDFWDQYKDQGGAAGGGYCATSGPGLPLGSMSVLGIFSLAGVSAALRLRRKRR